MSVIMTLTLDGDNQLAVASNQKLFTAMGVLSELNVHTTFRTSVTADAVDSAGVRPTSSRMLAEATSTSRPRAVRNGRPWPVHASA